MNTTEAPRLFEKAVILNISYGLPGVTKKVRKNQIEQSSDLDPIGPTGQAPVTVKADKELVRVSKQILDCPELRAITKKYAEIKAYVDARALPSYFRAGLHWWPLQLIEEGEARFNQFDRDLEPLIDNFIGAYPDNKAQALERLDTLADPSDYPTAEEVREKFYVNRQYISFQAPDNLPEQIRQQEAIKMQDYMQAASEEITTALRESMAGLVNHLLKKLTENTNESLKKRFYDSSFDKVIDFLDTFKARNLTDDTKLEALVDKAKAVVSGTTVDQLKNSDTLKAQIKAGFEEIQANLDPLMSDRTRKIVLED